MRATQLLQWPCRRWEQAHAVSWLGFGIAPFKSGKPNHANLALQSLQRRPHESTCQPLGWHATIEQISRIGSAHAPCQRFRR